MITRRSLASLLALPAALAIRAQSPSVPDDPYTSFDPDGTAHIKRALPVPKTISTEVQALMMPGEKWIPAGGTKEREAWMERMQAVYPVDIKDTPVAGVDAWIVTPKPAVAKKKDRVLICLHGGGFTADSGSQIESIPMAAMTGTQVISVRYRLAPKYPFPAAVDDAVAVYKDALKTHTPKNIAVYGTSAGAVLGAQVMVQLRKLGLPLPAALGFFSGWVDLSRHGDSRFLYGNNGLRDYSAMVEKLKGLSMAEYVADHDRKDPVLSPIYTDMKGFPPTLCMTSTRDLCLSGTANFHRALLRAGVETQLMVFDALPHAFWYQFDLPESKEALEAQASFLDRHIGH